MTPPEQNQTADPSLDRSTDPTAVLMGLLHGPRERGCVMIVREGASLEALQSACADVTGLVCTTLRYRLQAGAVFGSLMQAVIRDLGHLRVDRADDLLGTPVPHGHDPLWIQVNLALEPWQPSMERAERGRMGVDAAAQCLAGLNQSSLTDGVIRLVVFAEVVGSEGPGQSPDEWRHAAASLLPRLPRGMVLVIAGPPQGFNLPEDPQHYVEVPRLPGATGYDTPAGTTATRYQPAELLPDVPTTDDQLGRAAYADSLAEFLLHRNTAPPITIGLYGRWGSGKSSFFELLRVRLLEMGEGMWRRARAEHPFWSRVTAVRSGRRTPPAPPPGMRKAIRPAWTPAPKLTPKQQARRDAVQEVRAEARARDYIVTVRFNAWQYDDAKQTWAGLASTVSEQIEAALPFWRRLAMRFRYAWRNHQSDLVLNLALPAAVLLIAAGYVLYDRKNVGALFPSADPLLSVVLPAGSFLLLVWTFGWRVVQVAKPISERVASYVRRHDYRADMGYQHKVIDDLKFLLAELKSSRPQCRVLVYIDDLDRCSDEKIVEILRATILILADCHLFVMLGMDTEMIRRAIEAHYEKLNLVKRLPPDFAESYLRKIIQIALYLPESPPDNRFALMESMFSIQARESYRDRRSAEQAAKTGQRGDEAGAGQDGELPYDLGTIRNAGAVETVADTAHELETFAEFKDYLPDNARELKRLLNTHRFLKILLSSSSATPWTVGRQQLLVKWLLFCARWPRQVDDVLDAARASPDAQDCLAAAAAGDAAVGAFAAIGRKLSAADLLGDFELAARLSQVVYEEPAARAAKGNGQPAAADTPDRLAAALAPDATAPSVN
ncbi:MAG TPA: P-loop NTPase fold protein [Longimicrobium sp.]|nr:P-loop NTPase fold protein [Longimicrobium sp.]